MAITPYLTLTDANAAIEFYKRVFGATEKARMPAEDGKRIMHAELEFAGQRLFLSDNMSGEALAKGRPIAAVFVGLASLGLFVVGMLRVRSAFINL